MTEPTRDYDAIFSERVQSFGLQQDEHLQRQLTVRLGAVLSEAICHRRTDAGHRLLGLYADLAKKHPDEVRRTAQADVEALKNWAQRPRGTKDELAEIE